MNLANPFRRRSVLSVVFGAAVLIVAASDSANAGRSQEQQTSQSQQQTSQPQQNPQPAPQPQDPSAPKPKKVWSNDDVVALRTPADTYLIEKEAQEAADAEAAAKKAASVKQSKDSGLTLELPSTPDETQRLIKAKEEQLTDLQGELDRWNRALPEMPEDQRPETQKQIEIVKAGLQKAHLELRVLQDHFQKLAPPTAGEPPSAPPTPPSAQNP
jgi:hypothetical protein